MRIKKHENRKLNQLNSCHHPSTFSAGRSKNSEIFSISQLLEPANKPLNLQREQQSIFTDLEAFNYTLQFNHRILRKKDTQIKSSTKPFDLIQKEELIKSKIKQRIKEEFTNQKFIGLTQGFKSRDIQKKSLQKVQRKKSEPKEGRVFIQGSSLAFNPIDTKKRSRSSFLTSSLPIFNKKVQPFKLKTDHQTDNHHPLRQIIRSVEIKRKNFSSLAHRQQTVTSIKRKNSLDQIEPWEIEQGFQVFEIAASNQNYFKDQIEDLRLIDIKK